MIAWIKDYPNLPAFFNKKTISFSISLKLAVSAPFLKLKTRYEPGNMTPIFFLIME